MAIQHVRRGEPVAVLPSAARTATPSVDTFKVSSGAVTGLLLIIDVTAASASPSVVFTLLGYDRISGKTYTILASAAITGTGTTVLRVHPELTAAANLIAKDLIPNEFTVSAVHADADSITYSVSAHLL